MVRREMPGPVFKDTCRLEVGRECLGVVVEGDDFDNLVLKLDEQIIARGKLKFIRVRDQGGPHRVMVFVSEEVLVERDRFGEKVEVELGRERIC